MSTQNPLDSQIIKLIVAMFNAAPGAEVLAELRNALTGGESVENLARNLVQTQVFQSLYPDTLGSADFAARFAQNVLGEEVGFDQLAFATVELTALQLAGLDRGQVVLRAIEALLAVEPTNPEWGKARQAFENKVTVAEYYSIEKQKSAQTLEELQKVLAPVTSSERSTENAIRVVDGLPPLPEPGTPTTPVTPTPEPTPVLGITGLGSTAINENTPFSATPAAVNASGAVRWTLEGEDAALFSIDENTGELSMVARDFETPVDTGTDNRYTLTVRVTDAASNTATQVITITVTNVLEESELTITGMEASYTLNENVAFLGPIPAVSGAIGTVTWSLEGGDADRFTVDTDTGEISMVARDFETPADAGADNLYNVVLRATDADGNTAIREVDVRIVNVNESSPIAISGISDASVEENAPFISSTPGVSDALGTVTWSLTGEDAEHFTIHPETGIYEMVARDYESPVDADRDNFYRINVVASDTNGNSAEQAVSIRVTDVDDGPTLIIGGVSSTTVPENKPYIATATVENAVGVVRWSLGGPDAAWFEIDELSGKVTMAARDYESPQDEGGDNTYTFTIEVTDEADNIASQDVVITISNAQEESALSITGLLDGFADENIEWTSVSPEVEGAIGEVTWSLEGVDAAHFRIEAASGNVTLLPRDFENPTDSDGDNVYEVTVRATDADANTTTQALRVQVENIYEAATLEISGLADVTVPENESYSVTPTVSGHQGPVSWRLEGADAGLFSINASTGAISMAARDHEAPGDADKDNDYEVTVIAEDLDGNSASASFTLTVADVVDTPTLSITGLEATYTPEEEVEFESPVPGVTGATGAVTWSLEGPDADKFSIDPATGRVSMIGRDFETPADADLDNNYEITLRVTDALGHYGLQDITVSVADVFDDGDTPVLLISGLDTSYIQNENLQFDTKRPEVLGAIGGVTWSLEGLDAAKFSIQSSTGIVSMVARNFESPEDANLDNVYQVSVKATDSLGLFAVHTITVTIADVIESATLSISGLDATYTLNENDGFNSPVPTVTDAIGTVTWTLEGPDADKLSIDSATGKVSMIERDFEVPEDADNNNAYQVTVKVTDSDGNFATQEMEVRVVNVNESSPIAVSGISDARVDENQTFTSATPGVSDALGTVTWSLTGEDAARFTINAETGIYELVNRNYEAPEDADGDNVYRINVRASDTNGNSAEQAVTVTVDDVREISVITINLSDLQYSYEGAINVFSFDYAGNIGPVEWTLEGPDAHLFTIDSGYYVFSHLSPDYENPQDADGDNDYQITLKLVDADDNVATRAITVRVIDELEYSELSISGLEATYTRNENDAFESDVPTVTGAIGAVTWTLEGPDADKLSIDPATGKVSMIERNFEAPADADTDNAYQVTVKVTDSDGNFATQALTVNVADVIESATLSISGLEATYTPNENDAFESDTPTVTGAIGAVTWSLEGPDADKLSIDSATGKVSMIERNFEQPADADTNNAYEVTVKVTDSDGNFATQALTVSVADVIESATLSISGLDSTYTHNENDAFESLVPSVTGAIGAVTWSLEGVDADKLSIDSATGKVSMIERNFEVPEDSDTNNAYEVTVKVTDSDGNFATQALTVNVADVIESATLSISGLDATYTLNENDEFNSPVPTVTDAIGTVTWTLEGPDADKLSIDSATGKVSMIERNFEVPEDSDTNNAYQVTVKVTDSDGNFATQEITVSVADVIESATLSISGLDATYTLNENDAFESDTPTVTGAIGAVTWSLEGVDADKLSIDSATGKVSMIERNFEQPADADSNNAYEVTVKVTDSDGNFATQALTVSVANVVESATLSISGLDATYTLNENDAFESDTPTVTGAIGAVTWSLEGVDADKLSINPGTGVVSMIERNFEQPADADTNNAYEVTVKVTDSDGNFATQEITVSVADVIESATLSISGLEATYTPNENDAFESDTPTVTGAIGAATWTLEGPDADKLSIDSATGKVSMIERNFEAPADADTNNAYEVTVKVTDSDGNFATQEITVSVADVIESATLSISGLEATYTPNENDAFESDTPTVTGAIGAVTWSLEGPDADKLSIDSATGKVSMIARDYETPADADSNNAYQVTVKVTDSDGNFATQALTVNVADVIESATLSISGLEATYTPNENDAFESDTPTVSGAIGAVTWSLEGVDADKLSINPGTGVVSMIARDYEAPADADTNNAYEVTVKVTDSDGNFATQALTVNVADVIESATLSISGLEATYTPNENDAFESDTPTVTGAIGAATWSLEGPDADKLSIDPATGKVSMIARDYETPADADSNNAYQVTVKVTDSDGNFATQALTVNVADVIESATLSISGLEATYAPNENDTFESPAPTVSGAIGAVTWTLEGPDADKLSINPGTGVVSMIARDYETPADADTDNAYQVTVKVTDSDGNFATQALTVNVANVVETTPLTITSEDNASVNENAPFSMTLAATGGVGTITWSKTGGSDASLFSLSSTGLLSLSAKDAELAEDSDGNNTYLVQVQARDEAGASETLDLTVTVANIEDVITAIPFNSPAFAIDEDTTVSFSGADLFAQANFTDDFGVTLSSLTLSGHSGTLTVNGSTIASGATTLITATSTLTWRPVANVNGTSIAMFNAQATASDGNSSSVVAVNANVSPVPDASTLNVILYFPLNIGNPGYDINPATTRVQNFMLASNIFDVDGSMVLSLRISEGYSAADGDLLSINADTISLTTDALFNRVWDAATGTLTISPKPGEVPNAAGWSSLGNNIAFSTNDTDLGDSRTVLLTLVSGPDLETRSTSISIPFITTAEEAEAGMAFSVMSQEEDWFAADTVVEVAPVSDSGQDVQSTDAMAWWQLAESFAMLR